jgi:hypothetical protein
MEHIIDDSSPGDPLNTFGDDVLRKWRHAPRGVPLRG